jgi:invasion protein IalB
MNRIAAASLCLALALPAAAQAQQAGKWRVSCDEGPCQAYFSVLKDGKPLLSWSMVRDPKTENVVAMLRLPVMVALPPGAQILVGDKTIPAGFQFCDGTGCTAVALLDAPGLKALQAAPKARVAWFAYGAAAATTVELEIDGLTEALGLLASH